VERSHQVLGCALAAIGLIAGVGSSDLLEPKPAQATQEGTVLMAAQTPMVYDFTLNDIDGKPVSLSQSSSAARLCCWSTRPASAAIRRNIPTSKRYMNSIGRRALRSWHSPRTTSGSRSRGRMQRSKIFATPSTACRFHCSARSA